MHWVLIITILNSGTISVPMGNEPACVKAAADYRSGHGGVGAVCLNTDTGETR